MAAKRVPVTTITSWAAPVWRDGGRPMGEWISTVIAGLGVVLLGVIALFIRLGAMIESCG
jgi:hypothetical protein